MNKKILKLGLCVFAFSAGFISANCFKNDNTNVVKADYDANVVLEGQGYTAWSETTSIPKTAGKYYLTEDLVLGKTTSKEEYALNNGVTLNLNGHIITFAAEGNETTAAFYTYGVVHVEGYGEATPTSNAIYSHMASYNEGMFTAFGEGELYLNNLYLEAQMESWFPQDPIVKARENYEDKTWPSVVSFKDCTINFKPGKTSQWCYVVSDNFNEEENLLNKSLDIYCDGVTFLHEETQLIDFNYNANFHFANQITLPENYSSNTLFTLNACTWWPYEENDPVAYNRKIFVDDSFSVKDDKKILFDICFGDPNKDHLETDYFTYFNTDNYVLCDNFPEGKEKYFAIPGLDTYIKYYEEEIAENPSIADSLKFEYLPKHNGIPCRSLLTVKDGKLYYELVGADYDFSDGYKLFVFNSENPRLESVEYGWQKLNSSPLTPDMCGNYNDWDTDEVKEFTYDEDTKRYTFNVYEGGDYIEYYAPFSTLTFDESWSVTGYKAPQDNIILFKIYRNGEPFNFDITKEYTYYFEDVGDGYYQVTCDEEGFYNLDFYIYGEEAGTVYTAEAMICSWSDLEGYTDDELDTTGLNGTFRGAVTLNFDEEPEMPCGQSHLKVFTPLFNLVHEHSIKEPHSYESATCTSDGHESYYECSCGKYFSDLDLTEEIGDEDALETWLAGDGKVAATGHSFKTVQGQTSTCTVNGYEACYQCENCQAYFEEEDDNTIIDNIETWRQGEGKTATVAHSLKLVQGQDATCTADGFKTCYKCENCNTYFEDDKGTNPITDYNSWKVGAGKIAATGHSYGETTYTWAEDKCTATKTCTKCSDVITETKAGVYTKVSDATEETNEKGHYEVTFNNSALGNATSADFEVPDTMLESGLSGGAIAGIVVGSTAGCGGLIWLLYFLLNRKRS